MGGVIIRITRLLLKNFIGIKHGLGRDEVEINFPNNGKLITMFNGKNGSGKSTLNEQLTIFKQSFGDRKNLILEGKEGRKELDILDGENKYEVVHIYGKKAQSFIKKNGVELNENGGVRTFNEIVFKEFGITEDYFKIGKIGSNTDSFVQYTTTERKTFISKFLPDIEDYLEKFEIIKEKYRSFSSEIKLIGTELEKLKNKEEIETQIANVHLIEENLEKEIAQLQGEIGVLNSEIDKLSSETNVDISELNMNLQQKIKRREELREIAQKFIQIYKENIPVNELESLIESKTAELNKIEQEIAVLTSEKQNINLLLVENENNQKKKELKLLEYQQANSSEELKDKLENINSKILNLKSKVESNKFYSVASEKLSEFVDSSERFEKFMQFISGHYQELNERTVNQVSRNIELFTSENSDELLSKLVSDTRESIENQENLLHKKEAIYNLKESNLSQIEILKKRPNECSIDSCPFIKNALQFKNLPAEIEILSQEITSIKKYLEEAKVRAENISEIQNLYKEYNYYYKEYIGSRTNKLYYHLLSENGNLSEFLKKPINEIRESYQKIISESEEIIESLNSIASLETEKKNIEYEISFVNNNEKFRNEIENEIEAFKKENSQLKEKFLEKEKSLQEKFTSRNSLQAVIKDYKDLLQGKKEYSNLNTQINTLNLELNEIRAKNETLIEKKKSLSETEGKLAILKCKKNENNETNITLQNQLSRVNELLEKKKNLEENFENIKLIKDALDPNKGIPLYFVKAYLEKTKDITNELLDMAFNGKFEIDFQTSPTEFFIRVRSGENIKNDIKEASQGEIALTTISISLALIEQSIGKFNILSLDEIDGALDASNRGNFINILEKQAKKLGIEQIFVISHNDAFDLCSANLVLLNGNTVNEDDSEFMKNKEIIFKV